MHCAVTRRSLLSASMFAATASLVGCGADAVSQGSAQDHDASKSQVIVAMNATSEPAAGFDPLVSWGCGEHVHAPLIQSTLVTTADDLSIVGDLATEHFCSSDGLVWTFTIRDDAVFSNGEPLTASDVAFTVNGVIGSSASEADLSMVERAVAVSDTVVELHLSKPNNTLLYTLAVLGIVPEASYGDDYGHNPIGSGPYVLKQWDQGQQVIFEANPGYYGEAPVMERVIVVFMDEDAALAAVQKGDVDIAYTFATHADRTFDGYELTTFKTVDSRGISLPCIPAGGTRVLEEDVAYHTGNDVTCDVAVRRAINLAIDREQLIDNVLNGYGRPAFSVGDGMPWSSPDMRVERDIDAARVLLDEAGWKPGADGIRERDGVRAAFDLWYSSDDSVRPGDGPRSGQSAGRARYRSEAAGRQLGRDLPASVRAAGPVGLGFQRARGGVRAQLLHRVG